MAHKREAIRQAAYTLLNGQTEAGSNVYSNRVTNHWQSELPSIVIYITKEDSVPRSLNGRQKIRTIDMQVEVRVEANDSLDDSLDSIAQEIEELVEDDQTLSGTVMSAILTNTELELISDGERQLGKATLTFEVKYIE